MSETLLKRRTFVQGMGLAAMAVAGLRVPQAHAQQQVPWSAGTELPKLKLPADACETATCTSTTAAFRSRRPLP